MRLIKHLLEDSVIVHNLGLKLEINFHVFFKVCFSYFNVQCVVDKYSAFMFFTEKLIDSKLDIWLVNTYIIVE